MSYDLRPLSLAELLDRAFNLYRRHFVLFVGIMALPSLVMLVVTMSGQVLEHTAAGTARPENLDRAVVLVVGAFGLIVVMGILYWVAYAVALGASTAAVARLYKGELVTITQAYGAMRGRMGRLAWLLLQVFLRLFGILLLVIPIAGGAAAVGSRLHPVLGAMLFAVFLLAGLAVLAWMALRYAIAVPPAVLEDSTASEAIARSVALTHKNRLRVFVLVFFAVLVNYAAVILFQWPFVIAAVFSGPETWAGFWFGMAGAVTGTVASAVTSPLAVVAMAVLYYDLRIRKEGLDLEMMIAGLRGEPAMPPPSGAGGKRGFILPG